MKKEIGTKTIVVVLAVAVLMALWLGWQFALRPEPGQGLPPLSTRPKPLAPPGTYFPPSSGARAGAPATPQSPADLANEMAQRSKPR